MRLAICSLGLPGLNREPKVGSLLRWEQLCQPPRRLRVLRARAARSPALSSLAEPSRGSLFSEAAFFPRLGSTATDPQESAAAASVWQRQRPRALQPLRYRFPRSASGKPLVSWAPLRPAGRLGLPAPNPLRFLLARCRAARSPARLRAAGRTVWPAPARRWDWQVGHGAHCTPLVARAFGSRGTVDTDPPLRSEVTGFPGEIRWLGNP